MKKALITGITGQDGAYLAEFLLEKGYKVFGTYRRLSTPNFWRLQYLNIFEKIELLPVDLIDSFSLIESIRISKPDEIYNLAAQSFVGASFEQPLASAEITGIGVTKILEAIRNIAPDVKFYQASTSEMFGDNLFTEQSEDTIFDPSSPYAASKLYAHNMVKIYRKGYGLFACNGILFNHESPLRGLEFVTRKITNSVAKIHVGLEKKLELGNLDSQRDWGHAKDYIRMMWMILQAEQAEDWVIATGVTTPVREFVRMAFAEAGIAIEFKGVGVDEKGYVAACANPEYQLPIGKEIVGVDPRYFRPTEVDLLIGDATKAKEKLGWTPKYNLNYLVKDMMESDLILMKKDTYLKQGGYKTLNYFE